MKKVYYIYAGVNMYYSCIEKKFTKIEHASAFNDKESAETVLSDIISNDRTVQYYMVTEIYTK